MSKDGSGFHWTIRRGDGHPVVGEANFEDFDSGWRVTVIKYGQTDGKLWSMDKFPSQEDAEAWASNIVEGWPS